MTARALRRREFIRVGAGMICLPGLPRRAALSSSDEHEPGGWGDQDEVIRIFSRCGAEFGGIEVCPPRRHHGHF